MITHIVAIKRHLVRVFFAREEQQKRIWRRFGRYDEFLQLTF